MSPQITLALADPGAALGTVGGKGASLARLARAGLPVPDGFHITTAAYRDFVAANGLEPRIWDELEHADAALPATLEAASNAIQCLFAQAAMPPDIAGAIAAAYSALNDGCAVVAVRSSATAEDLPDLSFAGQQETFLNVRGLPDLLSQVKACWASLWTARAIGYRAQHHIDHRAVSLAVVVQVLVPAEAAGVLFTAHPVTGARDQTMLTATWGLGEALVGGLVTPDTLVVEKATGQVLMRETADKQVMTVRVEAGTAEKPVPEALRRAPVLSDAQAAELTRLGNQIEQLYGMPMDIEWALFPSPKGRGAAGAGSFAILQARPITALPPQPEHPTATEWKRPDPKARCFRGSITEQLPDPLTPLFATLGVKSISRGTAKLFNDLFGKGTASEDVFTTINGYAFYQMRLTLRMLMSIPRITISFWPEFQRSEQRWRDGSHKQYAAVIDRWRDRSVTTLTAAELLEAVRQLMAETVHTYNVLQSGILGLAGAAEALFGALYDRIIKRRDDPPPTTYLLGFDSLPILADKSLYDLAQQARANPALVDYLARTPAEQLTKALAGGQTPPGVDADAWRVWERGFSTHLERFGHAVYDLDFAKPLPIDNPAPLLETCKMYLSGQGANPHERQQTLASRREQAVQVQLTRLRGLRLKVFRKTLGWAQQYAPMREDSLTDLGLGYPLLRRFLREFGRRLTQAGMLEQPDDVYWLYEDEAVQAAAGLDEGYPLNRLAESILRRKAVWNVQKRATPPMALPEHTPFSRYIERLGPAKMDQVAGNALKGVACSAGRVTGVARVLHSPEEFSQMNPGDVLVASITTPAWTPLFAMASAIVTDVGGPLSHGSIVAREYGIPAVLGTGVATRRIHSGQVITVDGSAGTVTWETDTTAASASGSAGKPPEWKLPKGAYAAVRNNIVELMADPLSPLFATLGRSAINTSLHRIMNESFGMRGIMPDEIILVVNQYAYNNGSLSLAGLARVLLGAGSIVRAMFTGAVERWTDAARPRYYQTVEGWRAKDWRAYSAVALLDSARQLTESAIDAYGALISGVIPAAWISEAVFTAVYDRLVKRRGDPSAPAFLLGYDSLPILADKSLYGLAAWAREHPALRDYLDRTPTAPLAALTEEAPADVPPALWQDWLGHFQGHLRAFGHTLYDLDFAHPVPADDPTPVLDAFKLYLRGQGVDPTTRQRESERRRGQAVQAVTQRLRGWRLNLFKTWLARAQKYAPLRENGLAEIGLAYPLIREMLREVGRRLVRASVIANADDLYWLTEVELRRAAERLDAGGPAEPLTAQVPQRQAEHRAAQRVNPPMALPQMKVFGFDLMSLKGRRGRGDAGDVIKGVACSAGRVIGPARVLHGPEDFGQMKPGDVLVASITTPAWTPLFAMASAVVTDVGGPLSHGSIVAREYGIPSVLGTGVATRRIRNGQIVIVDGSAGTVTLTQQQEMPGSAPLDWRPPDPKGIYMRTSVVDLMPDPVSPLFASWGIRAMVAQMIPVGQRLTRVRPVLHDDYFTTINSYGYMNAAFPPRAWWWIITGLLPSYPRMLRTLVPFWRDEARPGYQATVDRWRGQTLDTLSTADVWRGANEIVDAAMRYVCGLMYATMGVSAGSEGLLTRVYDRLAKRAGDPPATALLMGWDNLPARADKSLYDLAQWARERPALNAHVLATPGADLAQQLRAGRPPAEVGAPEWQELQQRFARHLEQFGHMVFELDFAKPLPLDDPAPMLEAIKMALRGEGANPHERQRAAEARRQQTAATMLSRLRGLKLWAFRTALNWAQSLAAVREDALADIGLGYPLLRRMLRELGGRLAAAGAIAQADDIYFLERAEIEAGLLSLDGGQPASDLRERVDQRRTFWRTAKQATPPPMIPMKKKYMGINTGVWLVTSEGEQNQTSLKGVAASPGTVTAPACVIHGPEDFAQMKPGAVLVAGTTTPAWTPLFSMATAVVTDIGGPLSHGSIVAREYGIPAVMGTGVATRRIHSGEVITVDGGAGVVVLHQPAASAGVERNGAGQGKGA